MILWGLVDDEPRERKGINREEVIGMIVQRAKDYAAEQKALSRLNSQEKANLKQDQNRKMRREAEKRFHQIKLKIISEGSYLATKQDVRKAVEDIFKEHKQIIGKPREDYLGWIGEEEEILKKANNSDVEDLDLSDEM